MSWFFKCKHPAEYLHVQKDSTHKIIDVDYTHVTYHLYCVKCREKIDIEYSKLNGGCEAAFKRERERQQRERNIQ